MAQENKAGTNQNLRESCEEVNELQQQINELQHTLDSMRSENEQLADELVQSWNRHSENKLELSRECELGKRSIEQESVKNELKCYCAIEAKCVKWEVKEMRLLLPYIGAIEFHGVA